MRNLTATLCLTIAVFLGSAGVGWGQGVPSLSDLDYETASSIRFACVGAKMNGPAPYARCIRKHLSSIGRLIK